MSTIIKPVALNETVEQTNSILEGLSTDFTSTQEEIFQRVIDAQTENIEAINAMAEQNTEAINAMAEQNTEAINAMAETVADAIVGAIAAVKSINGKYGVVVLDSGDILVSKTTPGSKSMQTVLSELNTAVNETPLTFTPNLISGTDYRILVSQGSPLGG